MSFPTLVMLIGLPASGKSTLANQYKVLNYNIYSSDAIREELGGSETNQNINQLVFTTLHKRIKADLAAGISCVYDATNISYKRRMAFLRDLNVICFKKAIVVATPYEVCLLQNQKRERKVPEFVIERMYRNFDMPYYYEGWHEIAIHYNMPEYRWLYNTPQRFIEDVYDFDQQNKYHSETLGRHCELAADYVTTYVQAKQIMGSRASVLLDAALLHDNGKPFCQTFMDMKGALCESAHYYDHEHVGSYNSLFYDTVLTDRLYLAVLIRWHMQMHFIDKQPHTQEKYKKLFGPSLWRDLIILHKGDKEAHNSESSKESA